jgi:hypothetical protein
MDKQTSRTISILPGGRVDVARIGETIRIRTYTPTPASLERVCDFINGSRRPMVLATLEGVEIFSCLFRTGTTS